MENSKRRTTSSGVVFLEPTRLMSQPLCSADSLSMRQAFYSSLSLASVRYSLHRAVVKEEGELETRPGYGSGTLRGGFLGCRDFGKGHVSVGCVAWGIEAGRYTGRSRTKGFLRVGVVRFKGGMCSSSAAQQELARTSSAPSLDRTLTSRSPCTRPHLVRAKAPRLR